MLKIGVGCNCHVESSNSMFWCQESSFDITTAYNRHRHPLTTFAIETKFHINNKKNFKRRTPINWF